MRIVMAASMARSEYVRCPPGFPLAGARQASSAASESQTVRSPRRRRPASYSGQFRTRYRDFAHLYWLRLGYLIGGGSRSGAYHHHHVAKPGAMHQRRTWALAPPSPFPCKGGQGGSVIHAAGRHEEALSHQLSSFMSR